jgi:SAM-dependent methyltransferase
MSMLLYRDLTPWYTLVDPPEDHAEEAAVFRDAFRRAVSPAPETLLELGAGAGHNALHLKAHFRCTLTDPSEQMLALSRALNPECEHHPGDMRTLRLSRLFDAVLVHDAVQYMLTEEDLRAAARTAYVHLRPGGAALFAPDATRETFEEGTEVLESERDGRVFRGLMWSWGADPRGTTCRTEYALMVREGDTVRAWHDSHVEGLFPRATWVRLLTGEGFQVETVPRPLGDGTYDEAFLCRRAG